jgi:hypothetical protein
MEVLLDTEVLGYAFLGTLLIGAVIELVFGGDDDQTN